MCSQCYWVLDKTGKNYIFTVNAPHHVFDSTDASSYVIFFVTCGSYLCHSNFDSFSYIWACLVKGGSEEVRKG